VESGVLPLLLVGSTILLSQNAYRRTLATEKRPQPQPVNPATDMSALKPVRDVMQGLPAVFADQHGPFDVAGEPAFLANTSSPASCANENSTADLRLLQRRKALSKRIGNMAPTERTFKDDATAMDHRAGSMALGLLSKKYTSFRLVSFYSKPRSWRPRPDTSSPIWALTGPSCPVHLLS